MLILVYLQRDGTALPCFCSMLLEDVRTKDGAVIDAQRDFDIRWTANSMYSASLDTVSLLFISILRYVMGC